MQSRMSKVCYCTRTVFHLQHHQQPPAYFVLPLWSYLIPLFALFFHLYPFPWSQIMVTTHSLPCLLWPAGRYESVG